MSQVIAVEPTKKSFSWSGQQEAIFDAFRKGEGSGNVLVRARAGTGKTTTYVQAVCEAPEREIVVVSFNSRIKDEANIKLRNVEAGCEAKTAHGLGYGFVTRNWDRANVDKFRGSKLAMQVLGEQAPDDILKTVAKLASFGKTLLLDFEVSNAFCDRLQDVAIAFDCEPDAEWQRDGWTTEKVAIAAMKAMDLARHRNKDGPPTFDFDDMMFVPMANGWLKPRYDLVVVDEAQDMNAVQLEMAKRVLYPNGRMIYVGDDRQAIYAWRGADSDSLDRFKREMKATELGLTCTYRCGKVIVEHAKKLVPDFEAAATNHDGLIDSCTEAAIINQAKVGDFVISRINAPLAPICLKLNRAGTAARIEGKKDITGGLKSLVKRWKPANVLKLIENIDNWRERETKRLEKIGNATALDKIEFITDQANMLTGLCDGITKPGELLTRLDTMFGDADDGDKKPRVVCSSIHKAKGLEARRVIVLADTLYPRRKSDEGRPVEQMSKRIREEQNLEYVADTRAIEHLTLARK